MLHLRWSRLRTVSLRSHILCHTLRKTEQPLPTSLLLRPPTDSFADRRVQALRKSVRSLLFRPQLPVVLTENSPSCRRVEGGKRALPDDTLWMQELYTSIVEMASAHKPYKYHPRMTHKPNNSFKLLLPLVVVAQVSLPSHLCVCTSLCRPAHKLFGACLLLATWSWPLRSC